MSGVPSGPSAGDGDGPPTGVGGSPKLDLRGTPGESGCRRLGLLTLPTICLSHIPRGSAGRRRLADRAQDDGLNEAGLGLASVRSSSSARAVEARVAATIPAVISTQLPSPRPRTVTAEPAARRYRQAATLCNGGHCQSGQAGRRAR
jgi:hypothetical protein